MQEIDHIAIAVIDLEKAINHYEKLGLKIMQKIKTQGHKSGMKSAILTSKNIKIVLLESLSAQSPIQKYIEKHGPGVHHIAFKTDNIHNLLSDKKIKNIDFETELIKGNNLLQIFSKRDENSGVMVELIERKNVNNFENDNVTQLFKTLEKKDAF